LKYLTHENLIKLLDVLKEDYLVYVPVKKGEQRFYKKYEKSTDDIIIGEVRAFEPLKAFFSRARGIVAEDFKSSIPNSTHKPFCIVGVKACDLKGFKIQDFVFKGKDYQDPFYIKEREENLIISADCTLAIDTCFCLALDVKPHPTAGFDINISEVEGGYSVEVGSNKGKEVIDKNASLFQDAGKAIIEGKNEIRKDVIKKVEDNIKNSDIPHQDKYKGAVEKKFESDIWEDEAKTCVECGACTNICPTCHCFLLYDQKDKEKMARLRVWDSCMLKGYARVAGGGNPRGKLWMRLRNRFIKKFDFFPKVADVYACTGCGRCISACPAKIDIRKILKRLT